MKKRKLSIPLYLLAVLIGIGAVYYLTLPPLSVHSVEFWGFMLFLDAVVLVSYFVIGILAGKFETPEVIRMPSGQIDVNAMRFGWKKTKFTKTLLLLTAVVAGVLLIGAAAGSEILRAKTYSSVITVEERDFAQTIAETEYVSDIALMDTASARIVGERTLGTLSDLVSQYDVSYDYTQIAMRSPDGAGTHPYKVSPLEYDSFFKWLTNASSGIPGYVKVDAVEFMAEFVRLEDGNYIQYSPSAYFSKDLQRALRFAYPTKIFGTACFEVDDEGRPYWIVSTMKPRAGLFGAMDVDSVILFDACTGEHAEYKPTEAPDWVDIVYYGDLVCQKYDWHGLYSGGYINSLFSQTGCTITTDDFGYKIIGNDVYIFTGVTSTSGDKANIGFILANSRTGEYQYFPVPGAEEHSAMSAAEGSVQQYRYTASFPSLINVNGEATYIMVLKDASGIVKMYSMVNMENYNIVVTSTTQEEVFQKYKAALRQNGSQTAPEELHTEAVTVREILYVTTGGETTVYLKTSGGIFSLPFAEIVLFIEEGDSVTVSYAYKSENGVTSITDIEK